MRRCRKCGTGINRDDVFCANCGQKVENPQKSSLARHFLFILAAMVVLLPAGYLFFCFYSRDQASCMLMDVVDSAGEFMLGQLPPDVTFELQVSGHDHDSLRQNDLFSLVNSLAEHVDSRIKKSKKTIIIEPPSGGYEPGMSYTLTLKDGISFADRELREVRVLNFSITKEPVERVEYKSNVREIRNADYELVSEDTVRIQAGDYRPGDILVLTAKGATMPEAFKVLAVLDHTEDMLLSVSTPTIDELFEELEIYGTYTSNPDDVTLYEAEIEENIRDSGLLDLFTKTVYAGEAGNKEAGIKAKVSFKDGFTIVKITLEFKEIEREDQPGKFPQTLKIIFEFKCKDQVHVNINKGRAFEVGLNSNLETTISFKVETDHKLNAENIEKSPAFSELIKELEELAEEVDMRTLKILSIPIPICGPVNAVIDLEAFLKYGFSGNINSASGMKIVSRSGLMLANRSLKPYISIDPSMELDSINLYGTADAKTGLKPSLFVSILNVAEVGIEVELGGYAELTGILSLGSKNKKIGPGLFWYIDIGLYREVLFAGKLDFLITRFEGSIQLNEKKIPLYKDGNNLVPVAIAPVESTVYLREGSAYLPSFTITSYDIHKKTTVDSRLDDCRRLEFSHPDNISIKNGKISAVDYSGDDAVVTVKLKSPDRTNPVQTEFTLVAVESERKTDVTDGDYTVAVIIVIDVSGSMADYWADGIKIESARNAAMQMLNMLEAHNELEGQRYLAALVKFESDAFLVQPLTSDFDLLRQGVENLGAYGNTNIGDGLEIGLEELAGASYDRAFVILLSDGMTNRGRSGEEIMAWLRTQTARPVRETLQASAYGYREILRSGDVYYGAVHGAQYAGNLLLKSGYNSFTGIEESSQVALDRLPGDSVFYFNGHANSRVLQFQDGAGNKTYISSSDLSEMELHELNLAVLNGCQTAKNVQDRSNILRSFIDSGAKVGIGFSKNIPIYDSAEWGEVFWDRLINDGFTVYEAGLAGTWRGLFKSGSSRGLKRSCFVAYPADIAREVTLDDMLPDLDYLPEAAETPRIYTVGYGQAGDLDEELLISIARNTGGEYFYGEQGFALANIFLKTQYLATGEVKVEYEGTIKQAEKIQAGSFTLDKGESELRVALNWPGSEIELRVYDPQGNLLGPDYRGVKLWRTERPAYVVLERPRPGEWTVELYGKDVPGEETAYYVIASTGDIVAERGGTLEFLLILAVLILIVIIIIPKIQARTVPA